jgi:hypothetical protein
MQNKYVGMINGKSKKSRTGRDTKKMEKVECKVDEQVRNMNIGNEVGRRGRSQSNTRRRGIQSTEAAYTPSPFQCNPGHSLKPSCRH